MGMAYVIAKMNAFATNITFCHCQHLLDQIESPAIFSTHNVVILPKKTIFGKLFYQKNIN